MRELRISDADLQRMIGTALRVHLRGAGFAVGSSEGGPPPTFMLPINLNLLGHVTVEHSEDGFFTFTQESGDITDRLFDSGEAHSESIANRSCPR